MKKTWYNDGKSGTWDGEVEIEGKLYWAETDYHIDFTVDDGDDVTPPSTTIKKVELINPLFNRYDEELDSYEGGEVGEDDEQYSPLALAVEEKIVEYEYQRI